MALCAMILCAATVQAAGPLDSLKSGTPAIKSAGALAFGPEGVLFVGDSMGGAVFAIDTGDRPAKPAAGALKIDDLGAQLAGLLGAEAGQVRVNDMAVNPLSGNAYLSVTRGQGADAQPVLVRIKRSGEKPEIVSLKDVKFAQTSLANLPAEDAKDRRGRPLRVQAITDVEYDSGKVIIAGLSTEEFASTLRIVPFPFTEGAKGAGVKIYHGAHGAWETQSPVRTLTPFEIKGESHVLASYTCTPLVKFPVAELKPGAQVTGTTVAELGNRNNPLDMVVYNKDDKTYVLMANTARGVMKIDTTGIADIEGITSRISGTAGLKYETIKDLQNVTQLSKLDDQHGLILVESEGSMKLETIPLP
jgi:hypothetical protein